MPVITRNARSSFFFSRGTPDEFVRMAKIPKTMWVDLYVSLYREAVNSKASLDEIVSDARSRQIDLGKLGIR